MGISLLLVDLGCPFNIGNIMRTAYDLGSDCCKIYIYDPRNKLVELNEKIEKSKVGRGTFTAIENLYDFLHSYPGRILAADVHPEAVPLSSFEFQENDLVLLGNENRGFYTENEEGFKELRAMELVCTRVIVEMLGKPVPLPDKGKVVVPQHGLYTNCNVANISGIVVREALCQLGYYRNFTLTSSAD